MSAAPEFADLQFVVLSGPSGSGKTTIVERLLRECPVKLVKSVSATTRPPRVGEVEGANYYFLTRDEVAARRQRGEFLEYAEVHASGNWYGTLRSELQRARQLGGWSLLEIDVQGAEQVLSQYPNALSIFVRLGSPAELEHRLRSRATDDDDVIRRRLENAHFELQRATAYRYQVINDNLDRVVGEITGIIRACERERRPI
jgi:guanylate kinase